MKISKSKLKQDYGIELPAGGKYSIENSGDKYIIYTVKDDTEGCILVGMDRHEDGTITQSAIAFAQLMKILEKAKDIEIDIK